MNVDPKGVFCGERFSYEGLSLITSIQLHLSGTPQPCHSRLDRRFEAFGGMHKLIRKIQLGCYVTLCASMVWGKVGILGDFHIGDLCVVRVNWGF